MRVIGFSIVGCNGQHRITVFDADGQAHVRHFNNINQCLKWLKGCEKHERTKG